MNKRGFEFISTSSFILCQHLKRENKIVPKISGRTSSPSSQGSCHYAHGDMVENKKRFETKCFKPSVVAEARLERTTSRL